jgi:hypothetical protein
VADQDRQHVPAGRSFLAFATKPYCSLGEIVPKQRGSKVSASNTGDAKMLVLMNLIWRRLAYTLLVGMRSKLVRP